MRENFLRENDSAHNNMSNDPVCISTHNTCIIIFLLFS